MTDFIKAAQGDRKALEKIVTRYNEKAKTIASIYVGGDFEDIVQDVWLKIIDKHHLLSDVKNFDNWLFLVVRNACFNYLKVERKRRSHYPLPLHDDIGYTNYQSDCSDMFEKIIQKESSETLRLIVRELGEMYSLPIVMRYAKELSLDEISKILNLPVSTVKWRLCAAKRKIKNEIIRRGLI